MSGILTYLALSGLLTILLWVPYIAERALAWGIPTFLNNYPEGYPQQQPKQALWAARAQRAHLNMVETMPAFIAVTVAAALMLQGNPTALAGATDWAEVFFFARIGHAVVYLLAIPFLRTPVYLVSWAAVLMIGAAALS